MPKTGLWTPCAGFVTGRHNIITGSFPGRRHGTLLNTFPAGRGAIVSNPPSPQLLCPLSPRRRGIFRLKTKVSKMQILFLMISIDNMWEFGSINEERQLVAKKEGNHEIAFQNNRQRSP